MTHRNLLNSLAVLSALAAFPTIGSAQHSHAGHGHGVILHVNPRWKECSFQLDPALTPHAWRQFTREAGLVTYFRPLVDARPMGRGNFEVSAMQWKTEIDDTDAAWNDTFVHPDSAHWLFEGSGLKFPGLMVRGGVSNRVDVGGYVTKNPNANYGFYGGQLQYNVAHNEENGWAASVRGSFVSLYGPADLDFTVYGADVVASKQFTAGKASIAPYAVVSSYLATSREKSLAVNLSDENVFGAQGTVGVAGELSVARIGVEYSVAQVRSMSLKVGVGF
jgi:hypothetical protein